MNLVATLLAMSVIDKLGRKTLLLIGSVGTSLCLAGVAAVFLSHSHQSDLVWLLVGFIFFFAISQGAVIWVYISEVFPDAGTVEGPEPGKLVALDHERDYHEAFPSIAAMSAGAPFIFFSAMMALQFFVVLFIYPETKGMSLEQMQRRLGID